LEAKLRHAGVARQITKELTRRFEESRRNSLRAPKMRDDLGGEQDRESPKRLRFRRADFHVVFEIFERAHAQLLLSASWCKIAVYGLNGRRAHFVIALSLATYEHAI
jgi:hypothetical protein